MALSHRRGPIILKGRLLLLFLYCHHALGSGILQVTYSVFELLDQLRAEVRALGKLLLDVAVDLHVARQGLNFLLHLIVLEEELLALLRLVLQLRGQLLILQNRQPRCSLQLFVAHRQQVRLGLLYLQEHLFSEVLRRLSLLTLHRIHLLKLLYLQLLNLLLEIDYFARVRIRRGIVRRQVLRINLQILNITDLLQ